MPVTVMIILNEREAHKALLARRLEEQLQLHNILTQRFSPSAKIHELILRTKPKIIILDYLLGDFTTGLDLLEAIRKEQGDESCQFIFLTDEPSIQVAVSALRLGAANYIEIDDASALEQAIATVTKILSSLSPPPLTRPKIPSLSLADLTTLAPASQLLIQKAMLNKIKRPPVTVILGKAGTGRATLAQAIINQEKPPGLWVKAIDLTTSSAYSEEILGMSKIKHDGLVLGRNLTLILKNIETDQGQLLKDIESNYTKFWPNGEQNPADGRIIATTGSNETARAWHRLLNAEVISVPRLQERSEDFPGLILTFFHQAQLLSQKKIKPCSSSLLTKLSQQEWPGELRQLRAVMLDAFIASTFSQAPLEDLIAEAVLRWETDQQSNSEAEISALGAGLILEQCSHDYRIAAAKIGISVIELREKLKNCPGPERQFDRN